MREFQEILRTVTEFTLNFEVKEIAVKSIETKIN